MHLYNMWFACSNQLLAVERVCQIVADDLQELMVVLRRDECLTMLSRSSIKRHKLRLFAEHHPIVTFHSFIPFFPQSSTDKRLLSLTRSHSTLNPPSFIPLSSQSPLSTINKLLLLRLYRISNTRESSSFYHIGHRLSSNYS
jgi:hypothetical protein